MWNNKMKAFTLSYDDGVESDRKLLDIINYYGLKCTFNLNSGILGTDDSWQCKDLTVRRLSLDGIKELYAGHEIAVHGVKHLAPTALTDEEFYNEFIGDREALEKIFDTKITGMAYAYGAYDHQVSAKLAKYGFRYGRTVEDSLDFDLQDNLMEFKPTCHHDNEKLFELIDNFITMKTDKPQLFYLWGHSYEFDANNNWDRLVKVCEKIRSVDDIYCDTNEKILAIN